MTSMKIVIILVALVTASFAGTIDPSVPDSKYVKYGSQHECVLQIMGSMKDGDSNMLYKGSCVVIGPYYILTSAHVVAEMKNPFVIYEGNHVDCALVAIHSKFKQDQNGYNDIALARLIKPIVLDFYPDLYTEQDEVGKVCSIAGYGYTGTFKTGYIIDNFDKKKRAGANVIDEIHRNTLAFSAHKNKTNLEFLITPGDSGGGLFINQKLAGINSCVYATDGKTDSDFGDVGCSTRISDYIKWIKATKQYLENIIKSAENFKKQDNTL